MWKIPYGNWVNHFLHKSTGVSRFISPEYISTDLAIIFVLSYINDLTQN